MVTRVVAETVDRAATDPRTGRSFKDVKLARVKEKLVEQICELAGGGCKYTGDPMAKVHKGLKNTDAEMQPHGPVPARFARAQRRGRA